MSRPRPTVAERAPVERAAADGEKRVVVQTVDFDLRQWMEFARALAQVVASFERVRPESPYTVKITLTEREPPKQKYVSRQ